MEILFDVIQILYKWSIHKYLHVTTCRDWLAVVECAQVYGGMTLKIEHRNMDVSMETR